jgi:twitching motility two-component system response regulator PilH
MAVAKILIIEDSPLQSRLMIRALEKAGHHTILAEDGAAGVEACQRELPDLVLMDVIMPHLNGFQATRRLAMDPITQHIPIIIVSTKDMDTDKVWGFRQGAKGYISKPFNEGELLEAVNDLLRKAGK